MPCEGVFRRRHPKRLVRVQRVGQGWGHMHTLISLPPTFLHPSAD